MVTIDDFKKIDLKIARVLSAERIHGSEKLLKLRVSLGNEERQILAGIGKAYVPEDLVDKNIAVIANLEPRLMMGLESQGMLLAAEGETGPIILIPEKPTLPGASIH